MSKYTSPEAVRSLYRALLRAASYLPTPETRVWTTSHIIDRYHRKIAPDPKALRKARQGLNQLERAIEGDIAPLTKVFMHTYGRSGPRRRLLLTTTTSILSLTSQRYPPPHPPLLPPPAPRKDTRKQDRDGRPLKIPYRAPPPTPSHFQKLLADQKAHRPDVLGRTKIRFIDPPVPERDGWGNSVPRRREGGIVGRWLREALDNVLPPLPTAQWDYLKAVGLGEERCGPLPVRRTKVGTWGSAESLLSVENLKVSIRTSQADVLRDRVNQRNRHDITPKFLQRLHASIWHLSPKMTWDEESKNWRYGWGKPKGSVLQGKRTAVSPRDLQLFEGLENMEGVVDVVGGGFKGKKARKKARAQALKQLEAARMEKEKTVGEASETASF